MKRIRMGFSDMWGFENFIFNPYDNYFTNALRVYGYEVEIDQINPDILFYSCFGLNHQNYKNSAKIFFQVKTLKEKISE